MQANLALLFLITLSCAPQLLADCDSRFDFRHHVQPIFVKNSKYTVQENGEICCPLNYEDSECIHADEMKCSCPHGLVSEPCHHCKTCAKGPGEMCGGMYGAIGKCAKGLTCTADRDKFIRGLNITGICVGDGSVERDMFEQCGEFEELGSCKDGLNCSKVGNKYICVNTSRSLNQAAVCTKDCSESDKPPVCGSDGRVYDNICFLRQQRCKQDQYVKKMGMATCHRDKACRDITPPPNGFVRFSPLGLKHGANATILCKRGYKQYFPPNSKNEFDFPALECNCTGGTCEWMALTDGSKWIGSLPECASDRERECRDRSTPITTETAKSSETEGKINEP